MIHIFQIQNSRGCQYFTSCSVVLPLSLIPCKKRVPVSQSLSDTLLSAISVDQYYFSYFGNRSSTHITDVAVLWGWKYLLMCISEVLQIFRINCRVGNKVGWLCSGITATPSLHLLCLGAKKESVYFGTLISIHNNNITTNISYFIFLKPIVEVLTQVLSNAAPLGVSTLFKYQNIKH